MSIPCFCYTKVFTLQQDEKQGRHVTAVWLAPGDALIMWGKCQERSLHGVPGMASWDGLLNSNRNDESFHMTRREFEAVVAEIEGMRTKMKNGVNVERYNVTMRFVANHQDERCPYIVNLRNSNASLTLNSCPLPGARPLPEDSEDRALPPPPPPPPPYPPSSSSSKIADPVLIGDAVRAPSKAKRESDNVQWASRQDFKKRVKDTVQEQVEEKVLTPGISSQEIDQEPIERTLLIEVLAILPDYFSELRRSFVFGMSSEEELDSLSALVREEATFQSTVWNCLQALKQGIELDFKLMQVWSKRLSIHIYLTQRHAFARFLYSIHNQMHVKAFEYAKKKAVTREHDASRWRIVKPVCDLLCLMGTIIDEGHLQAGRIVFDVNLLLYGSARATGKFSADTWSRDKDEKPKRDGFEGTGCKLQLLGFEVNYPSEPFIHKISLTAPYLQKLRSTSSDTEQVLHFLRSNMFHLVSNISQQLAVQDVDHIEQKKSVRMWNRDENAQYLAIWVQRSEKLKKKQGQAALKGNPDESSAKLAKKSHGSQMERI